MAELALEQTGADELWFVPAAVPPHKDRPERAFQRRVRMVERLIGEDERMRVSAIESQLPSPSYTIDTVRAFKARHPDVHFRFLMGADSLAALPTWRQAERLAAEIEFLVAPRTGYPIPEVTLRVRERLPQLRVQAIAMPILDVSSTWLRQRLANGRSTCGLVPASVLAVWREENSGCTVSTGTWGDDGESYG
jgi:nicotinate-nucleotide adenylyltransferase